MSQGKSKVVAVNVPGALDLNEQQSSVFGRTPPSEAEILEATTVTLEPAENNPGLSQIVLPDLQVRGGVKMTKREI